MSEQTAEATPDVQQSDGAAEQGIELGKTTSGVVEQGADADEQTETGTSQDATNQGKSEPKAPESYEFTPPEGVTVDADMVAAFGDFAKSLDLTQDQAQEQFSKLAAAQAASVGKAFQAQVKAWTDETRKDPELGGDNFQSTLVKADQALAVVDPDGHLTALLNNTGLASNKAVLSALTRVRDAIADDKFVAGTTGEQGSRSAKAHFPNSPQLSE